MLKNTREITYYMSDKIEIPTISIVQGDCFSLMTGLPDGQIDLVVTDPPYNTTNLAFEVEINWPRWWREIDRVTKENAAVVLFSCQPFTTTLINSNRACFRYDLIWRKNCPVGHLDAKRRPLRAHEIILVFSRAGRGKFTYNPVMRKGKFHVNRIAKTPMKHYGGQKGIPGAVSSATDEYYPISVLDYNNRSGQRSLHPTAKPVDLLQWLVKTFSNPGELVLDTFMGSGSTGKACLLDGRKFIGYELDPKYFEIAKSEIAEVERFLAAAMERRD
jgi:site-specific DNA-methyltransferase (adenine-specific)